MSKKFNLSAISGMEQVGEGLLSDASKAQRTTRRTTTFIHIRDIDVHPLNNMSMSQIKTLAETIRLNGCQLEQPVEVRRIEGGRYLLLAGHRRIAACKYLIDNGQWVGDEVVEAKIREIEDVNLPLDDEDKDRWLLLVTNLHRVMTDADKAVMLSGLKDLVGKLRIAGVETIALGGEEGVRIKGRRTREVVSDLSGIGEGTIGRFEKVEKNASDAVKEAMAKDEITVGTAAKLSGYDKDTQDEMLNAIREESDAPPAQRQEVEKEAQEITVEADTLTEDLSDVFGALSDAPAVLGSSEYAKYKRLIGQLHRLLVRNRQE